MQKFSLFVYASLKSRKTVKQAIGHIEPETRAVLPGYEAVTIKNESGIWPTIVPSPQFVRGDILTVSEADLKALDKWENRYSRIMVKTSEGEAYTYVYRWIDNNKAA